jgi:opacity protein-like surface antigen
MSTSCVPRPRRAGRAPARAFAALSALAVVVVVAGGMTAASSAAAPRPQRYVSPAADGHGDGSRRRPWRTIQQAAARARPGDTVHVAAGRYRGPLRITRSGTRARPIHFVSEPRWAARIAASGAGPITVVEIRGDRVVFDGFDITATGSDGTAGIDLEGSHDAVVHNHVHDLRAPCSGQHNGSAAIVAGGGLAGYRNHDLRVDSNFVDDIGGGPRDGRCRTVHGIYAAVPRVTIVNNSVARARGDGITSWHAASRLTITNNLSTGNGGAGILIGSGDSGAGPEGDIGTFVVNNIVDHNRLYGIMESSDGVHPVGPGNRYLNNLAFENRGAGDGTTGVAALYPGAVALHTIQADPQFSSGSLDPARRYRVAATSPAVDAGTTLTAPRKDFDGMPRPQGRGVDIGPYELSLIQP